MRATMAAMEQALAGHGFVRTHRAWLVNRARVEGLAPAGSGDVAISLSGGVEALLSRRYRRTAEPLLVT
jgi:DNA-binding LytR/AlgR family response regulator